MNGLAFVIERATLLRLLTPAVDAAAKTDFTPSLRCVRVVTTLGEHPGLRLEGTDLATAAVTRHAEAAEQGRTLVHVIAAGSALVPAAQFLALVRSATDATVAVQVDESKISVISGKASWFLTRPTVEDFPVLPDLSTITWTGLVRTDLLGAVQAVRHAVATEAVRTSLCLIDVDGGRMRASDGVRVQQVALPGCPDMQVPAGAIDGLVKMLSATEHAGVQVATTETSLLFTTGERTFIAQRPHAQFPDVEAALLRPALANDEQVTLSKAALVAAVRQVRVTADPDTSAVTITLAEDTATVSAKDAYGSHAWTTIPCVWPRKAREIHFHAQQLIETLSMVSTDEVTAFLGKDIRARPSVLLVKDAPTGALAVLNQTRADWRR